MPSSFVYVKKTQTEREGETVFVTNWHNLESIMCVTSEEIQFLKTDNS